VRDATAFVGAEGIAEAVGTAAVPLRWAEIDEAAWTASLARKGPIRITIPVAIDTFDGSRLRGFESGVETVTAEDVAHLVNGAQYLNPKDRKALLEGLARAVLISAGANRNGAAVSAKTELDPAALAKVLAAAAVLNETPRMVGPAEGVH
jgi:hypothetical protein